MSAFSALRRNVLAGSRGRFVVESATRVWTNLLSFLLLPAYLALLGTESFAIVSLYTSVQIVISLLDGSMAPSLTREIARTRGGNLDWGHAMDMTRTLEVFYGSIAVVIGIVIALAAPLVADHWLKPEVLSQSQISGALYLAAAALAAQWPTTLYVGGLQGLQAQIPLALVNSGFATARAVITLLCLWLVSPTMQMMFVVALVLNVGQLAVLRTMFWSRMPRDERKPSVTFGTLAAVWKFAAGVSVITVTTQLLPQIDRMILSRFLSLEQFGHYAISIAIASALYIVTGALFSISFPRLTELVAGGDAKELVRTFRKFVQFISLCIVPVSAVMVFFSSELLRLWTRSNAVASSGGPLLSIYVIGSMINCLLSVPYTLMLSYGVTRSMALVNVVLLLVVPPLEWMMFPYLAAFIGPAAWVAVNVVLFTTAVAVAARRLKPSRTLRWMLPDILSSIALSFGVACAFHMTQTGVQSTAALLAKLFAAWAIAAATTLLALPLMRHALWTALRGLASHRS